MPFKVIPPKIQVYRVVPRSARIKRQKQSRRFVIPLILFMSLVVGTGAGTWLSWTSRFGEANKEAQLKQVSPRGYEEPKPIALEFDQSDLAIVTNLLPILIEQNRHEPTPEDNANKERKEKLRDFLASYGSPLAKEDSALNAFLSARNMKMMLAISFVESNMCKRQLYHNCSGIGGSKMRKYDNFAGWIKDFDDLLERKYKGLAVEDFIGYYVQPGSQNWVDGVYQILDALKEKGIE